MVRLVLSENENWMNAKYIRLKKTIG